MLDHSPMGPAPRMATLFPGPTCVVTIMSGALKAMTFIIWQVPRQLLIPASAAMHASE